TLSIDGKRFAMKNVIDHQRDQFLGKVIGSVVVRTATDDRRKVEAVIERAYEVIACRLRRGIRGTRIEVAFLSKVFSDARFTIDFVRRDMVEQTIAEVRMPCRLGSAQEI